MGQKRKNGLRNCKRFQTVQSSRFTTCMFDFKSSQGIQCGLVVYSWGAEALCLRACHAQTILALHEIIVCGKQEAAPVLQPRYGVEHEIVLVAASST